MTVFGTGGWGTCLAVLLAREGHQVTLWGHSAGCVAAVRRCRKNTKFLPGVAIPETVSITSDFKQAWQDPEFAVLAIPSEYLRQTLEPAVKLPWEHAVVISAGKGIETGTLLTMSGVVRSIIPSGRIVALSGPAISYEVARGVPTAVVAASREISLAEKVQRLFSSESFRVYTSGDLMGVELGGSLKNVIAIACGVADGLGFGTNTKAALVTRGLAEMARLGVAMGAKKETFAGLSGMGDLVTTCFSPYSRNRGVGEELGKGVPLAKITKGMEQVAEGITTAKSAYSLSQRFKVEMPITWAVYRILYEGDPPKEMVRELMLRDPKPE